MLLSCYSLDFFIDCLEHWWRYRKKHYPHIEQLHIDVGLCLTLDCQAAVKKADVFQLMSSVSQQVQPGGTLLWCIWNRFEHGVVDGLETVRFLDERFVLESGDPTYLSKNNTV